MKRAFDGSNCAVNLCVCCTGCQSKAAVPNAFLPGELVQLVASFPLPLSKLCLDLCRHGAVALWTPATFSWAFPTRNPGMGAWLPRQTAGTLAGAWCCWVGMATRRSGDKHLSGHATWRGRSHGSPRASPQEMLSAPCHSCYPCSPSVPGWERLAFTEERLIFLSSVAEMSPELEWCLKPWVDQCRSWGIW